MRGFKNNFVHVFFLLSPPAVKRDIGVTILLGVCACVHACMLVYVLPDLTGP